MFKKESRKGWGLSFEKKGYGKKKKSY